MNIIGGSIASNLLLLALTVSEAQASGITLCAGNNNSNSGLKGCLGWNKSSYYRNHYFVSLEEPEEEEKEPEEKEEIEEGEDEITSTSVASVKSFEEMPQSSDDDDVWNYENGLLVTGDGKCLGLNTCSSHGKTYLWEKSCKPYSLKLQNCPPTDPEDDTDEEMSRHMRFLMTDNGQIRSLAAVLDERNDDIMTEKPYCITMLVDPSASESSCVKNEAYLMPCLSAEEIQEEPTVTVYHSWYGGKKDMIREQFFNFEGTSEPFIMPLQRSWGHDDVVEMVYHVGIDSSPSVSESNSSSGSDEGKDEEDEDDDYRISLMSTVTDQVVGTIETPCKTTNGFLDFNPAEYGVTGPITCVMEGTTTSLAVSMAAFEVEPEESHVASKSVQDASYTMPKNVKFFLGIVCGTVFAIALHLLIQGQQSKKASLAAAAAASDDDEKTVSMDADAKDLGDDDDDDVTTASSSAFDGPSHEKN